MVVSVVRGTHLLNRWRVNHSHWHHKVVRKTVLHLPVCLTNSTEMEETMHHTWVARRVLFNHHKQHVFKASTSRYVTKLCGLYLEMIFALESLPEVSSVNPTHPPNKKQAFPKKKRGMWIYTGNTKKQGCGCKTAFYYNRMANTCSLP